MFKKSDIFTVDCPRCGTPNYVKRELCRYCECPLHNRCASTNCDTPNKSNARFCKIYGHRTLFNKYRVFDEAFCADKREEARMHYKVYGDPESPAILRQRIEYNKMKEMEQWYFDGCPDDYPEPPIEDE